MIFPPEKRPVFRFAPSPNGNLHLGHALSAILNAEMAKAAGGRFLLRIEDIDISRCKPEFEHAIEVDLAWLGLEWEKPVRRQSEHVDDYRSALGRLKALDLVYPAFMSRNDIRKWVAAHEEDGRTWPRDPDGSPHYPPIDKTIAEGESAARVTAGEKHVWRLDMEKALRAIKTDLFFDETGDARQGRLSADPAIWGDVMLWRWDAPASYHLSVVVDDAIQGVSHVVRGLDLFHATHLHRLLQTLLGLPTPIYHHHRLILDDQGRKLSKSNGDTAISALRNAGMSVSALRALLTPPIA